MCSVPPMCVFRCPSDDSVNAADYTGSIEQTDFQTNSFAAVSPRGIPTMLLLCCSTLWHYVSARRSLSLLVSVSCSLLKISSNGSKFENTLPGFQSLRSLWVRLCKGFISCCLALLWKAVWHKVWRECVCTIERWFCNWIQEPTLGNKQIQNMGTVSRGIILYMYMSCLCATTHFMNSAYHVKQLHYDTPQHLTTIALLFSFYFRYLLSWLSCSPTTLRMALADWRAFWSESLPWYYGVSGGQNWRSARPLNTDTKHDWHRWHKWRTTLHKSCVRTSTRRFSLADEDFSVCLFWPLSNIILVQCRECWCTLPQVICSMELLKEVAAAVHALWKSFPKVALHLMLLMFDHTWVQMATVYYLCHLFGRICETIPAALIRCASPNM